MFIKHDEQIWHDKHVTISPSATITRVLSEKKLNYINFQFNLDVLRHLKDRALVLSIGFKAGPPWPALLYFSNTFNPNSWRHVYLCTQTLSAIMVSNSHLCPCTYICKDPSASWIPNSNIPPCKPYPGKT